MAVFRVEKTKDFTIMSNHHLRNTELSLKAKGLLSLMLSLPEDWDYTTKGLAHICKDGVDSITTALKELERHGYLTRQRLRYDNGQLGDIEYTIHEQPVSTENTGLSPKRENPRQVKPEQAKPKQAEPEQANPVQLNTNPLKTKKSKKDKSITYPSIYPAEPEAASRTDGMDRIELIEAYREIIKENIEYVAFRRFVCLLFYGGSSSNDLNNGVYRSEGFPVSYGSQRGRSLVRRCPDDGFRHAAAGYKKKYPLSLRRQCRTQRWFSGYGQPERMD